jgi:hypothetical protein
MKVLCRKLNHFGQEKHGEQSVAVINLNHVMIETDAGQGGRPPRDNSLVIGDAVYFRDLEGHLVRNIRQADAVIGCVAWLTSRSVLEALAAVPFGVSVVVQKEDFLRPDGRCQGRQSYFARYSQIPARLCRRNCPGLVSTLSTQADPSIQPIRCVGQRAPRTAPVNPRMHNKFFVFCRTRPGTYHELLVPYRVWTGSYNPSWNATNSLENAVVLDSPPMALAFYNEWSQIFALSEPLDWESEWVAPELREGS